MTWCRGDLAVCIADPSIWTYMGSGSAPVAPSKGTIWRVENVGLSGNLRTLLNFRECQGFAFTDDGWRKAVLPENEACEPDFIKLLDRSKAPNREPVRITMVPGTWRVFR